MLAKPSARPPATIQNQGLLFGEIITELIDSGRSITSVLTLAALAAPVDLEAAIGVLRSLQQKPKEPHTLRDDNTHREWLPRRLRGDHAACIWCNVYNPNPAIPDPPSGF